MCSKRVSGACGGQKGTIMWELGTEPGSLSRGVRDLNCLVVSPAPSVQNCYLKMRLPCL